MLFHERLKNLRERENLSREHLSKSIGISYSALSKYETGDRQPDFSLLQKIARYFKVTTDYLLGMTDVPNAESEEFKEYVNDPLTSIAFKDFENLTDEQKQEAIEMIKFIKFKEDQKER